MGRERYQRIQKLWIAPTTVTLLNEAAEALMLIPEVITIDEKLKPFEGESPCIRYVPNKNPHNGHWITETTVKGRATGLPYLLNCIPIQEKEGPAMVEIFKQALERIGEDDRKRVVVVADAYYLDDRSRTWLREGGFKYLMAINPTRFKEVWEYLGVEVKAMGQWAVAWNAKTKEAACQYWDPEFGKKYILTNAFRYHK